MQRQVGTDHGHTSRVADIHSHGVGAPGSRAFVPFHEQLYFGNDALVAAQLRPTLLQRFSNDVRGETRSHVEPRVRSSTGAGRGSSKVTAGRCDRSIVLFKIFSSGLECVKSHLISYRSFISIVNRFRVCSLALPEGRP